MMKTFQDSGVKKLFILGIAQGTQEEYENVAQLWTSIQINVMVLYFQG